MKTYKYYIETVKPDNLAGTERWDDENADDFDPMRTCAELHRYYKKSIICVDESGTIIERD